MPSRVHCTSVTLKNLKDFKPLNSASVFEIIYNHTFKKILYRINTCGSKIKHIKKHVLFYNGFPLFYPFTIFQQIRNLIFHRINSRPFIKVGNQYANRLKFWGVSNFHLMQISF